MLETVVLIAIPVIALLLTVLYVMREERKARRWRQIMADECRRCPLFDEEDRSE
jgi:cytochrome c-type biogenesis protein CcmH/NrfF